MRVYQATQNVPIIGANWARLSRLSVTKNAAGQMIRFLLFMIFIRKVRGGFGFPPRGFVSSVCGSFSHFFHLFQNDRSEI